MAVPSVKLNSFLKKDHNASVCTVCKVFIIFQWLIGINRTSIINQNNPFIAFFCVLYTVAVNCVVTYASAYKGGHDLEDIVFGIKVSQYLICTTFGFITWRRLQRFYNELNKFDSEIGFKPNFTWPLIRISCQFLILYIGSIALFWTHKNYFVIPALFVHVIQNIECHYYAHLHNLLVARLQLVNDCVESSLSTIIQPKKNRSVSKTSLSKSSQTFMNKLLDIYRILVTAQENLIDAIKWQLLVIITTTFIFILGRSYIAAILIIRGQVDMIVLLTVGYVLIEFIPLFLPCTSCDQVRTEVQRLRELLASKLYEGKIDKSSRSVTRTLLALTEARDLSFSLLRMVDISISLPFKFLGLLVTYLIILLQFEKVINP